MALERVIYTAHATSIGGRGEGTARSTSIAAEVDFGPRVGGGFGIAVRMAISVPGMERARVEELVEAAHQVCPYSNATRGNVDVTLTVV